MESMRPEHEALPSLDGGSARTTRDVVVGAVRAVADIFRGNERLLRAFMHLGAVDAEISRRGSENSTDLARQFAATVLAHRDAITHPDPETAVDVAFRMAYCTFARQVMYGPAFESDRPIAWGDLVGEVGDACAAYLFGSRAPARIAARGDLHQWVDGSGSPLYKTPNPNSSSNFRRDCSVRLGTTAFSFTDQWLTGRYTLDGLLRRVAELGLGPGIELIGFQTWRDFPSLTRQDVLAFRRLVDELEPLAALGGYADLARRVDRRMTTAEAVEYVLPQVSLAAELGFPVLRLHAGIATDVLRASRLRPSAQE